MIARRRAWSILIGAVILLLAIVAWRLLVLPGALDFAGGTQVELASYKGASPVGVPAELAGADPLRPFPHRRGCWWAHRAAAGRVAGRSVARPRPASARRLIGSPSDGRAPCRPDQLR
jgi:hypothetical protein